MSATTVVGVVVVAFDCADEVVRCLASLVRSAHPPGFIEICENAGPAAFDTLRTSVARAFDVALSDMPTDATTPFLRESVCTLGPAGLPLALRCAPANVGYAGGINLCLQAMAGADWDAVLVLNPDIEVEPAAIGAFVEHARDARYGIIGGRILFAGSGRVQMYGCRWRSWIGRVVNIGLDAPGDAMPDVPAVEAQIDFVCGAVMYVTRAYVEAVGPLDDAYFLYMEEVDYCIRRGPFRLGYAHAAVAHHAHGSTTGASRDVGKRSPLTIYLGERNKLRFTRKFFAWRYPVVLVTTLCLTALHLRGGRLAPFRAALAGWFAGLIGETGHPRRLPS